MQEIPFSYFDSQPAEGPGSEGVRGEGGEIHGHRWQDWHSFECRGNDFLRRMVTLLRNWSKMPRARHGSLFPRDSVFEIAQFSRGDVLWLAQFTAETVHASSGERIWRVQDEAAAIAEIELGRGPCGVGLRPPAARWHGVVRRGLSPQPHNDEYQYRTQSYRNLSIVSLNFGISTPNS